jgi:hypothetical protein
MAGDNGRPYTLGLDLITADLAENWLLCRSSVRQARRMISDEDVPELLRDAWSLGTGIRVTRHDGGTGSQTWVADRGKERWVAKPLVARDMEEIGYHAHGH